MTGSPPRVSVLMAAHDAERFLRPALASVLRQTVSDLELVVVDDGSTDDTSAILDAIGDQRLVVVRNAERQGLAASLNRGLEAATARYVARLDADDVARPERLERQLDRIERGALGIVGSGILEIDEAGRPGAVHLMPASPPAVRWAALFSSPFYHPSVLVDRVLLEDHHLRYDPAYAESEDYDLWTRVLALADGANATEPLVLYRIHAGQASQRRRGLQRGLQRQVALREIARLAPELGERAAELAWRVGAGLRVEPDELGEATAAFVSLRTAFEARHGDGGRGAAAAALARAALRAPGSAASRALVQSFRIDPSWPAGTALRRASRPAVERAARRDAERWLAELDSGAPSRARVAAVFPEPTPYRAPLLDLVAQHPELDLTVIYAADTVARRTWAVEPRHRAVFLRGARVPGAWRLFHHDYPLTPGIARALRAARPDVVVVSGWSTFAAQASIVWCRGRHVPYVLVVESHDEDPRPGWRRGVKGTVVPRIVRESAGALVTGTLAHRSLISRGAAPEGIGIFANTIDVDAFAARAAGLAASRDELRRALGVENEDVAVLSVARLAPEKGLDTLVRAAAAIRDPRLVLVLAGEGSERARLAELARELAARVVFAGDVAWGRIVELYVAADVFVLLSEREPWGVVVNEAAACGLPLVLSDRVGAAYDLLRDGENGALVPAGDVQAAAEALRQLAEDEDLRRAYGARSRELVAGWGYRPSVDAFAAAVRRALPNGPPR
ncbi:MAG TPA: glycosyltransferase [Gaiellaceae bacterium]|nr:glycosyltransferase [Gaiellaceae bacterium]